MNNIPAVLLHEARLARSDAEVAALVARYPEFKRKEGGLVAGADLDLAREFMLAVVRNRATGPLGFAALVKRFSDVYSLAILLGQEAPQAWNVPEVMEFARPWSADKNLNLDFIRFYVAHHTGEQWTKGLERLIKFRPLEAAKLLADTDPSPERPVTLDQILCLLQSKRSEARQWALIGVKHVQDGAKQLLPTLSEKTARSR